MHLKLLNAYRKGVAMTFTPTDDYVLIRRDDAVTKTSGGIIVPERDASRPLTGTVVATGPGAMRGNARCPVSVVPGDRVLHGRYAGTEVTFDDALHLVLREADILGVLDADGGV